MSDFRWARCAHGVPVSHLCRECLQPPRPSHYPPAGRRDDLAEFLLARIAEDEESARGIAQGAWEDATSATRRESDHVFRWSPQRVLAECEAKRQIIGAHHPEGRINRHSWSCGCGCQEVPEMGCACGWRACPTLRLLGIVYADHPDYREEWKP